MNHYVYRNLQSTEISKLHADNYSLVRRPHLADSKAYSF